ANPPQLIATNGSPAFRCGCAFAMAAAPSFFRIASRGHLNVSEAEIRAGSQYLCLRIRADGEGDRLSRIRRALAVFQGNQPDGHPGAGHGAWRADRRTWR